MRVAHPADARDRAGRRLPLTPSAFERVEVAMSGEPGYVTGRWAVGVDTPRGRAEASGHYLSVWRRRGEVWRQIVVSAYVLP